MRVRHWLGLYAALATLRLATRLARIAAIWRSLRLRRLLRRSLALTLALALSVAPLTAQESGEEQLISPPGVYSTAPSVAMDDQGAFVVAWMSQANAVVTRRYAADGTALDASVVTVASDISSYTGRPDVTMDSQGAYVVAWDEVGTETYEGGVLAQRYDQSGQQLDRIRVASGSGFSDRNYVAEASVAMDRDGDFVVAWAASYDSSSYGAVFYRRYDASGTAMEDAEQFVASGEVSSPAVALDDDGDFVIAWQDRDDVFGYHYDASSDNDSYLRNGASLNNQTSGSQGQPDVAIDDDGSFVVTWNDNLTDQVDAQRFNPDGTLRGNLFVASAALPPIYGLDSEAPAVAYLAAGPIFAWATEGSGDTQDDNETVFRRFGASGPRDPAEERVAELFRFNASFADIAASPFDSFVVVWEASTLVCAIDCSRLPQIYMRLYLPPNSFALSTSTASTHEGSGEPVTFSILRESGAGPGRVGYSFGGTARFGEDYTISRRTDPEGLLGASGELSFAAGQRERQIELAIVDDQLGEPQQTIVLMLAQRNPFDRIGFPVALVTLADDDLAEVRIVQTGGSTVVRGGDPPERLAVALRTVPAHPVVVTLTPTDRRLNLGLGYGVPLRLTFRADESAKTQQWVSVFTIDGQGGEAGLAANAGIALAAASADPGYDRGARFTVDGRDLGTIPVDLVTRPGENPNPVLPSVFLPGVVR